MKLKLSGLDKMFIIIIIVLSVAVFFFAVYQNDDKLSLVDYDPREQCGLMTIAEAMSYTKYCGRDDLPTCWSYEVERSRFNYIYSCNEDTSPKTWWIDLSIGGIEKEGCNPACVIDTESGNAVINYRCIGVEE